MACKACRTRKIKCDRARPVCQNCKLRSSDCTYAGERRTRHWLEEGINGRHIQEPVTRNVQVQRSDGTDAQRVHGADTQEAWRAVLGPGVSPPECASPGTALQSQQEQMTTVGNLRSSNCPLASLVSTEDALSQMVDDNGRALSTPASSPTGQDESLLDRILDGHNLESLKNTNPAVWMRVSDGDEYTGPSSGISTISDLGLNWVRKNVADSDTLCGTIQDIRNGIINHLRHPKCLPQPLSPGSPISCSFKETPQPEILRYVDAYFSDVQILFPILDRSQFLAQLSTFGTDRQDRRYSWMALINAVLASGCRAAFSNETAEAFKESGRESWAYFQQALSFESRIMHDATDLMAVQAMAVMTVFAQGLSSPQKLEYTLCSIASRLAHSLALNHHPPPEWDLTEDEKRERDRVFWVIYCLDKSISLRCGRPSVIYDDDISCWFPRGIKIIQGDEKLSSTAAQASSFDFFLCWTRLSRISGNVSRKLYSATALYTDSHQLLQRSNRLMQDLASWLQTLPKHLQPGRPLTRMLDTGGLSRTQVIVLHLSYYYVLCAVYRRFTPIFSQDGRSLEHLIDRKSQKSHIEAARSMVLLTMHLDIESYTPAWLVFYYPFTALTTIFLYIASNPSDESTQSDIALMEAVVGFFGRLEYVTAGETAFTMTTEFVRQARRITDRHGNGLLNSHNFKIPTNSNLHPQPMANTGRLLLESRGLEDDQLNMLGSLGEDLGYSQHIASSCMNSTSSENGVLSPQLQWNGSGGTDCTARAVDRGQSPPTFPDFVGHSAPPSDMRDSHWLGDWMLIGEDPVAEQNAW